MSEENKENLNNEENNENLNEELDNTPETEETAEPIEEKTVEEPVGEIPAEEAPVEEETAEEPTEAAEEIPEPDEVDPNEMESDDIEPDESFEELQEQPKKSNAKVGIIAAVAAVVIIVAAVLFVMFSKGLFNKYNRMGYIDVSGRTIAEVADSAGYELADFLEMNGLPADMPGNTYESAALYNMPVKNIAQMYGMTFDDMKTMFKWGDDITEDTAWGIAEGEIKVADYVGEENVDDFKQQYGFGDEVTGETQWKEIRNTLDQKSRDDRLASEKAAKDAEKATDAPAEDTADAADATDAPAEATDAPAAE